MGAGGPHVKIALWDQGEHGLPCLGGAPKARRKGVSRGIFPSPILGAAGAQGVRPRSIVPLLPGGLLFLRATSGAAFYQGSAACWVPLRSLPPLAASLFGGVCQRGVSKGERLAGETRIARLLLAAVFPLHPPAPAGGRGVFAAVGWARAPAGGARQVAYSQLAAPRGAGDRRAREKHPAAVAGRLSQGSRGSQSTAGRGAAVDAGRRGSFLSILGVFTVFVMFYGFSV